MEQPISHDHAGPGGCVPGALAIENDEGIRDADEFDVVRGGVRWLTGSEADAGAASFSLYVAPPPRDATSTALYRLVRDALAAAYPIVHPIAAMQIELVARDCVHLAWIGRAMGDSLRSPVVARKEDELAARRCEEFLKWRRSMERLLAVAGSMGSAPPAPAAEASRLAALLEAEADGAFKWLDEVKRESEEAEEAAESAAVAPHASSAATTDGRGNELNDEDHDLVEDEDDASRAIGSPDSPAMGTGDARSDRNDAARFEPHAEASDLSNPCPSGSQHDGAPVGQSARDACTDGVAPAIGATRRSSSAPTEPLPDELIAAGDDADLADDPDYRQLVALWHLCETMRPVRARLRADHVAAVLLGAAQLGEDERRAWTMLVRFSLEQRHLWRNEEAAKRRYDAAVRASLRLPAALDRYRELRELSDDLERAINARLSVLTRLTRPAPRTRARDEPRAIEPAHVRGTTRAPALRPEQGMPGNAKE
jgi:hypothetical protein